MLMMAGLYPPKGDQVWNDQLSWQPVPYSSQELNEDSVSSINYYNDVFAIIYRSVKHFHV